VDQGAHGRLDQTAFLDVLAQLGCEPLGSNLLAEVARDVTRLGRMIGVEPDCRL
jgi:hypothetical protein